MRIKDISLKSDCCPWSAEDGNICPVWSEFSLQCAEIDLEHGHPPESACLPSSTHEEMQLLYQEHDQFCCSFK